MGGVGVVGKGRQCGAPETAIMIFAVPTNISLLEFATLTSFFMYSKQTTQTT